jgi:hypothetical protein
LKEKGPYRTIATVRPSPNEFVDRGYLNQPLQDDFTYYYRLVVIDADGRVSPPSTPVIGRTQPPPDPPVGLRITDLPGPTMRIEWEPSPSEGVVKYIIERARLDVPERAVRIGETAQRIFFDDGGSRPLPYDTPYLYSISSINLVDVTGPRADPVLATTRPFSVDSCGLVGQRGYECHWV